jgi:hypothetical protein
MTPVSGRFAVVVATMVISIALMLPSVAEAAQCASGTPAAIIFEGLPPTVKAGQEEEFGLQDSPSSSASVPGPVTVRMVKNDGAGPTFFEGSTTERGGHIFFIVFDLDDPPARVYASYTETFPDGSACEREISQGVSVEPEPPPYLSAKKAKRASRVLLERKFYWDILNGRKLNCGKKKSRTVRVCKFFGFAGDGSIQGKIRVSLFSKENGNLHTRLRFRALRKDYYCHAVRDLPWSKCQKRYQGRTRVNL